MRVIFMGTPDFAVPALNALADAGHDIVAAYSQPPRPGGRRGKELTPSPVQRAQPATQLRERQTQPHHVEPLGRMRMQVEFHDRAPPGFSPARWP